MIALWAIAVVGLPLLLLLYVVSTVLPGPLGRLGGMMFLGLLGLGASVLTASRAVVEHTVVPIP